MIDGNIFNLKKKFTKSVGRKKEGKERKGDRLDVTETESPMHVCSEVVLGVGGSGMKKYKNIQKVSRILG